jgi:hypothetical protein
MINGLLNNDFNPFSVILAYAGIRDSNLNWIPVFTGMTN